MYEYVTVYWIHKYMIKIKLTPTNNFNLLNLLYITSHNLILKYFNMIIKYYLYAVLYP